MQSLVNGLLGAGIVCLAIAVIKLASWVWDISRRLDNRP